MNDLETQLKTALVREEPPVGFAGRVLARVAAEAEADRVAAEAKKVVPIRPRRRNVVLQALAAAALVTIASGGMWRLLSRAPNENVPSDGIGPRVLQQIQMVAPIAGMLAGNRPQDSEPPAAPDARVTARPSAVRVARRAVSSDPSADALAVERRRREEDAEAERNAEQVLAALRFTNVKLDEAQQIAFGSLKQPGHQSPEFTLEKQ